jgi:hypothetical protein
MKISTILLLGGAYYLWKNHSAAVQAAAAQAAALVPSIAPVTTSPVGVSTGPALPPMATGLATALGQPIPPQSTSALK